MITSDSWVLSTVEHGLSIPFEEQPTSPFRKPNLVFGEQAGACDCEVASLVEKFVIEEVSETDAHFVCGVFLIPKQEGRFGMIINLKPINRFIKHMHFKMESLTLLRDVVRQGDFFTKIDLTDAYLSVPLHEDDRKYIQFFWKGRFYQFRTLCFGLSSAPWAFTKLLKPIVAYLRNLGLRIIVYLDDILIINETKEGAENDFKLVKLLTESCGFVVNISKSISEAHQTIDFLGTTPNSLTMRLTLKPGKPEQIKVLCDSAIRLHNISLRELSKILGNFSLAVQAVPYAQSHFRYLQSLFNDRYHKRSGAMNETVSLDTFCISELEWWRSNIESCSGNSIEELKPDLVIYSDASLSGWGATMNGAYASGPWDTECKKKHINELELLAAFNALRSFESFSSNVCVHLMLDNTTSMAYINNCGGTHSSELCSLALDLVRWCEERSILVRAFHIAGKDNVVADYHSRFRTDSSDWMLDHEVFAKIQEIWPSSVDPYLVASVLSHPAVRGAFKKRRDKAVVTLVTLLWPTQAWFPLAVELTCDSPRLLSQNKRLLTGACGELHPLMEQRSFRLIAWRLSGNDTQRKAFQETCLACYWKVLGETRIEHTNQHGDAGIIGVSRGRKIPFHLL